jgi:hypothetical protein
MKNSRLVEEAKLAPDRIYSRPQDILRDRRLADPERLEILSAWEREARGDRPAPDAEYPHMRGVPAEGATGDSASAGLLREIEQARKEIEARLPTATPASATGQSGQR